MKRISNFPFIFDISISMLTYTYAIYMKYRALYFFIMLCILLFPCLFSPFNNEKKFIMVKSSVLQGTSYINLLLLLKN